MGNYEEPTMKRTVVPFRNAIMLPISTGYAESVEASGLIIAAHAGDHRRAFRRHIRGAEMGPPQGDAGIRHAGDPRLELAALAEVIHGHAVLPAEVEHRRRDRDARPEGAHRFEMMDGNGKLPPIRRVLPLALLGRQLGRIDRHLQVEDHRFPWDLGTRALRASLTSLVSVDTFPELPD